MMGTMVLLRLGLLAKYLQQDTISSIQEFSTLDRQATVLLAFPALSHAVMSSVVQQDRYNVDAQWLRIP